MCSLEGKDQRQFGAPHQKRERHQSDLHRAADAGAAILHLLVSFGRFSPLTIARLNLLYAVRIPAAGSREFCENPNPHTQHGSVACREFGEICFIEKFRRASVRKTNLR